MRPLQKGIFLPPALFANAHLLLNTLPLLLELKNKHAVFANGLGIVQNSFTSLAVIRSETLGARPTFSALRRDQERAPASRHLSSCHSPDHR